MARDDKEAAGRAAVAEINAVLVLLTWDPHEHYMATRLGRATLERGGVEHYLSGGR